MALQATVAMGLNLVEMFVHYYNAKKRRIEYKNELNDTIINSESLMSPSMADEFCVDFNDRSSLILGHSKNRLLSSDKQDSDDIVLIARSTFSRSDAKRCSTSDSTSVREV